MTVKVFTDGRDALVISMFNKVGWSPANRLEDADLVCLSGGPDVCPYLYGEDLHPNTHISEQRDEQDEMLFDSAIIKGKPIVGICRGGQFLHVAMGGKLWQHTNKHTRGHLLTYKDKEYNVTSTHHQIMRDMPEGARLLAEAQLLGVYGEWMDDETGDLLDTDDVPQLEIVVHDEYPVLSFQPHPEYCIVDPDDKTCKETEELFFRVLEDEFEMKRGD